MSEMDFEGYLGEAFAAEPQQEAVEEPVAEVAAEETAAEESPAEEQPRDEQGRFASQEPELILGKYKSVEDALQALEHSQREIGRLGQELGELRQSQEQYQQPAPRALDVESLEEHILENPAVARQAAVQALTQGDDFAYQQILRTWAEVDTFGALDFQQQVRMEQMQHQLLGQVQPQIDTAHQFAERESLNQALGNVQSRHQDFAEVVGNLDDAKLEELVNNGFPTAVLQGLNGDVANKEAAFETLYRWVKAERQDLQASVTERITEEQAAQSRQTKAAAAVASASSQPVSEGTAEAEELDEFYKFLAAPSPTTWTTRGPQQ